MHSANEYIKACAERLLAKSLTSFLKVPEKGDFREVHEWEYAPEELFREPLAFQFVLRASSSEGKGNVRTVDAEVINGAHLYKAVRMVFIGTMKELSETLPSAAFSETVVSVFLHLKDTALQI